jgi:hypothetical protein
MVIGALGRELPWISNQPEWHNVSGKIPEGNTKVEAMVIGALGKSATVEWRQRRRKGDGKSNRRIDGEG